MADHARDDIGYLLTAYADGALAPDGVAWVEQRLAASAELRARLAQVRAVRAGLGGALPPAPVALSDRRMDALLGAAAGRTSHRSLPMVSRWRVAALAAMVVFAVAAAVAVAVPNLTERRVTASDRVASAPTTTAAFASSDKRDGERGERRSWRMSLADEPDTPAPGDLPSSAPAVAAAPDRAAQPARDAAAHEGLDARAESDSFDLLVDEESAWAAPEKAMEEAQGADTGNGLAYRLLDQAPRNAGAGDGFEQRARQGKGLFGGRAKESRQEAASGAVGTRRENAKYPTKDTNAVAALRDQLADKRDAAQAGEPTAIDRLAKLDAGPSAGHRAPSPERPSQELAFARLARIDADREESPLSELDVPHAELDGDSAMLAIGAGEKATDTDELLERLAEERALGDQRVMVLTVTNGRAGGLDGKTASPSLAPQALAERLALSTALAHAGKAGALAAWSRQTGLPVTLAPDFPVEATLQVEPSTSDGRSLVATARRSGMQVSIDAGCLVLREPAPLDPTADFGMTPDAFRAAFGTRPMTATALDAKSTFALDQDTASYDQVRAALARGEAPDAASIQAEHFVNAMPMDYPAASGPEAFTVFAEAGPSPFAAGPLAERTWLVSIGVVAKPAAPDERKPLRLTLAIDCSGSMAQAGGHDAVVAGLRTLIPQLRADDRVAVVAFADQARVVLPPTPGDQHARIDAAIAELTTRGTTNLAEGLAVAYRLAAEDLEEGCEHRVLVASDGASLDAQQAAAFAQRAAGWRARGISLMALGCGAERAQHHALEALADKADGQHWHVASREQAQELFATRLVPGRLALLARDAKIQVTFAPDRVSHFRLIGYEERRLAHRDFRDDAVDAGELAQDSQTTALYEIVVVDGAAGPIGTAGVRYFDTRRESVRELTCPLPGSLLATRASPRLELAACAAEFAEVLGRSWWSNVRCGTLHRLRDRLARCPHPSAADLLTLVDRAIAIGVTP
ncbi:MAG TPA: von Willebrand factor type A domain-containing protein [Planctomycetota bacterium]|nr:von Willebrand factor type A domain-containing protein [Planctomycetota bacterium]